MGMTDHARHRRRDGANAKAHGRNEKAEAGRTGVTDKLSGLVRKAVDFVKSLGKRS